MKISRDLTHVSFLTFVALNMTLLGCVTNIDRSRAISMTDDQVSATSNFTDQMVLQKNLTSTQSSDIKDIKKLTSEEVQLLKSLGQEFSKTTTQSSFTALGVFFLGITLVIYGLRLTLKATDRRTSRYFKAMMWGLITPAIALIATYQIGIPIYKSDDSFFLISLLLMIPAGIIIFLLIAERRLIGALNQKDQQQP
jgi:hypothetical protein